MPGRGYTSQSVAGYRFGFNTQERDDEIYGKGNANSAEYWEFDTRLGRRWNNDPKPYVELSVYSCFANNPIAYSDEKGDIIIINGSERYKRRVTIVLGIIDQTNIGHRILTVLKESQHVFVIRKGSAPEFIKDDFRPKEGDAFATHVITFYGAIRDLFSLGKFVHELGHAEDEANGVLSKLKSKPWFPPDVVDGELVVKTHFLKDSHKDPITKTISADNDLKGLDAAEASAMDKENTFRAEVGDKLQKYYAIATVVFAEKNPLTGTYTDETVKVPYGQVHENGVGTNPDFKTDYNDIKAKKIDYNRKSNYESGKKYIAN